MLRKILQTVGSRALMALANLALLFITTRILGAEVKGQISLFVLNVSVLTMVSGIFSGPSLVYLTPRLKGAPLLFLAYAWALIVAASFSAAVHYYALDAGEALWALFTIGLMECLLAAHLMTLLGQEKIGKHNMLQIAKPILTVVILLLIIHFLDQKNLSAFLIAYAISSGITLLLSFAFLPLKELSFKWSGLSSTIRESWRHGLWIQIGNIAQLLNYRASYYFLEILTQPDTLALVRIGIYSAAIQVAESLWLLARSVATVQYSAVSNLQSRAAALHLSIRLIKFNYSITALGCIFLLALPESFYSTLLGNEFSAVKTLTIFLIPGIIFLSISNGVSHFFAGVGDNRYNAQASILGLITSIGVGFAAVFYFSMWGAAIAASITYVLQTLYQLALLVRKDGVIWSDLLVNRNDLREFNTRAKDVLK